MPNPQLDPTVQQHTQEAVDSIHPRNNPPRIGRRRNQKFESRVQCIPCLTAGAISFLTDILLLALLGIITLLIQLEVIIPTEIRGFYRDDERYMRPFNEEDQFPTLLVGIVTVIAPLILFLIVELITLIRLRYIDGWMWKRNPLLIAHNVAQTFLIFLTGYLLNMLLFTVIRNRMGVLRPDFIARCQPDYSVLRPNTLWVPPELQDRICTGDEDIVLEGRKSSPSGHALGSAFCMIFASLNLNRLHSRVLSTNFVASIQFVLIAFSVIASVTRFSDNLHRGSDLIVGYILGVIGAYYWEYHVRRHHVTPLNQILYDPRQLVPEK